jgi:hypothetical protein
LSYGDAFQRCQIDLRMALKASDDWFPGQS